MPGELRCRPSAPLPREIPRSQEKLLFHARVGMLTAAGGVLHGVSEECPLCGEPELGRNGATLQHIIECLPAYTDPSVTIDVQSLWTDPATAATQLALASARVAATPRGRELAAHWQSRHHHQHRRRSVAQEAARRAAAERLRDLEDTARA